MKKTIKIVISTILSTVLAISSITPVYKQEYKKASAVSNTQLFVDTALKLDYIGNRPNEVTNYWGTVCDWCAMFVYYVAYRANLQNYFPKTS